MRMSIPKRTSAIMIAAMLACMCALVFVVPQRAHAVELTTAPLQTQLESSGTTYQTLEFGQTVTATVEDPSWTSTTAGFKVKIPSSGIVTFKVNILTQNPDLEAKVSIGGFSETLYKRSSGVGSLTEYVRAGTLYLTFSEGKYNGLGDTTKFTVTCSFKKLRDDYPNILMRTPTLKAKASVRAVSAAQDDGGHTYRIKMPKAGKFTINMNKISCGDTKVTLKDAFDEVYYSGTIESGHSRKYVVRKGTYYLTIDTDKQGTYRFSTRFSSLPKGKLKSAKFSNAEVLSVKWQRRAGTLGYEIQVAGNKKFTRNKTSWTVDYGSSSSSENRLNSYKAGKKYYVRMRNIYSTSGNSWSKTNAAYSQWSATKTVRAK